MAAFLRRFHVCKQSGRQAGRWSRGRAGGRAGGQACGAYSLCNLKHFKEPCQWWLHIRRCYHAAAQLAPLGERNERQRRQRPHIPAQQQAGVERRHRQEERGT